MGEKDQQRRGSAIQMHSVSNRSSPRGSRRAPASPRDHAAVEVDTQVREGAPQSKVSFSDADETPSSSSGFLQAVAEHMATHMGDWGTANSTNAIRRATTGSEKPASQAVAAMMQEANGRRVTYSPSLGVSARRRSAMVTENVTQYALQGCHSNCRLMLGDSLPFRDVPPQSRVFGIGDVGGCDTLIGHRTPPHYHLLCFQLL